MTRESTWKCEETVTSNCLGVSKSIPNLQSDTLMRSTWMYSKSRDYIGCRDSLDSGIHRNDGFD